jgi:hypothetical protein
MHLRIAKIFSLVLFALFFFFNFYFYKSDMFKSNLNTTRQKQEAFIKNYGMKLEKIETNKNFKIFIDNSEYFKKIQKQPKFWELIK